ncbi:PDR/VanB family oxidoreductase [Paraburkholderia sp. MM5384-R2]|uniref:PDR/VanB family oxidoreductase n=1 Tax=Paraburkholderia sp. MM5384-R2 TaxID=2723097 RepID=UPI0017D06C27|nr:PDR/VanB family oxidoreductase [Paraburkholderia sp. MM5384-R2]MBB5498698.1 vanillate O-demethylase ferredoxin subunit [Paraburkholderia sp. MM5384-R2]
MNMIVKVAARQLVAEDVCAFDLVSADGSRLPSFTAGSHIDVHLPGGPVRQYSICNDPTETHRYSIGVLKAPGSRGGSVGMHRLKEGTTLTISLPRNHFQLSRDAKHSVLVAGGIGITPLLSMAESLARAGDSFELHYCARSSAKLAFMERMKASSFVSRVILHLDDGDAAQRFDAASVLSVANGPATHVYVCGPGGFIDYVLAAARAAGYGEELLHREYFASAIEDTHAEDRPFQIRIASSGEVLQVGTEETALSVLAKHGVDIPTSCEQGVCGTCLTRVLEGRPLHRDMFLTDEEHAANDQFTPCCSRSCSPLLVLDL